MNETITIKGTEYVLFSVEKFSEGGWAKKDLANLLNEHGIKTSFHKNYAYSPYVGQFGILVEKKYEDEVSEFLWGHGDLNSH